MVAGDHANADPRLPALGDRVASLLARRVHDPHQRQQRQVADLVEQIPAGVEPGRLDVARGHGEHAEPLAGQTVVRFHDPIAAELDRNGLTVGTARRHRAGEQRIGRALDEATNGAPTVCLHFVERGHQLVLRVKRHLGQTGVELPRPGDVEAALRGQHDERGLGRVAHDLAVRDARVVRQGHRQQERLERRLALAGDVADPSHGGVALAVDRVAPADQDQLAGGHLVERQRARLVGADRRCGSERLDRSQPLDDRSLGGQRASSQRQHRGDDRGQLGRDRRDGHADPDHEQFVEIVTVGQAEDDHQRERDTRHRRHDDRQLVELLGQRRLLLLDRLQHPRDAADLGLHPGRGDDHLASPTGHGRVHVGHVGAVAERHSLARRRGRVPSVMACSRRSARPPRSRAWPRPAGGRPPGSCRPPRPR